MPTPNRSTDSLRVLMTLTPAWSHLNTVVPIARALEQRGHEVRVATAPSMTAAVAERGLTAVGVGQDWLVSHAEDHFPGFLTARPTSLARMVVPITGTGIADDLLDLAAQWRPDVVLRDATEFGGLLASLLLDLPLAVVGIGLRSPLKWLEATLTPHLPPLRQQYGLSPGLDTRDFVGDLWLSSFPSRLGIAQSEITEYHLRPVVADQVDGQPPPPEWLSDIGADAVYVTLGTVFNQHISLMRLILQTLGDEGLNVVATTGSTVDPDVLGRLPANVRVAGYVPQSVLAPHVRAVVSHGGFNTVMGALTLGVPVCCIPLAADHPVNAMRCVELEVGTSVTTFTPAYGFPFAKPAAVTEQMLVEAVDPLLRDEGYRRRATALRGEIDAMPGPDEAAVQVEDLARA